MTPELIGTAGICCRQYSIVQALVPAAKDGGRAASWLFEVPPRRHLDAASRPDLHVADRPRHRSSGSRLLLRRRHHLHQLHLLAHLRAVLLLGRHILVAHLQLPAQLDRHGVRRLEKGCVRRLLVRHCHLARGHPGEWAS